MLLYVALPTSTQNASILSFGHRQTTIHKNSNRLYSIHLTTASKGTKRPAICYAHALSVHYVCHSVDAVSRIGVLLRRAWNESRRTVLMRHFAISTYVNCYQTHCRWQLCDSAGQWTVQLSERKTFTFTSPIAQTQWRTPLIIIKSGELLSSMSTHC